MRIMNLSLRQSIAYQKLPFEESSPEWGYLIIMASLSTLPIGGEVIMVMNAALEVSFLGQREPYDEAALEKIANAEALDAEEGDFILEAGSYHFAQFPIEGRFDEYSTSELALKTGDQLFMRILKEAELGYSPQFWVKRRVE
ncbi:MAG: hypothetical protein WC954_05865 [Sphaerochaeta sp.]